MNQKNNILHVIGIVVSFLILLTMISGCISTDKNSETQTGEEHLESTQPVKEQKETPTQISSNEKTEIQPPIEQDVIVECDSCESCMGAINNAKEGTVIKLTKDIKGHQGDDCINNPTNFNNMIFDCQEHIINGDALSGFYLNRKSGNTIKNCVVSDFGYGFFLQQSLNNNITNNIMKNNIMYGIRLEYSSNNNFIINNIATNNWFGISLDGSLNNTINNNTVNDGGWGVGIILFSSNNTQLIGNTICNHLKSDIRIINSTRNLGQENTCNKAENFGDQGTTGCTYKCS